MKINVFTEKSSQLKKLLGLKTFTVFKSLKKEFSLLLFTSKKYALKICTKN